MSRKVLDIVVKFEGNHRTTIELDQDVCDELFARWENDDPDDKYWIEELIWTLVHPEDVVNDLEYEDLEVLNSYDLEDEG